MKFSEQNKFYWWLGCLALIGVILYARRDAIISGSATDFDVGLLAVTIALVLMPFFSEYTFLGLTLKREVEDAKKDIKQEMRDLIFSVRTDIQNSISANSSSHAQVVINQPPPPKVLEAQKEFVEHVLGKSSTSILSLESISGLQGEVPDDALLAFVSRYQIELELRRIASNYQRVFSIPSTLRELVVNEIIPPQIADSIKSVMSIANAAIHGEAITNEQQMFLRDVAPPLIDALKKISGSNIVSATQMP